MKLQVDKVNLIEKWRSRETKKKLREENIKLKLKVETLQRIPRPQVCVLERNMQEVRGCYAVSHDKEDMPAEYIKRELVNNLIEYVKPFVEYDVRDSEMGGKVYIAKLYVATGDRR